MYQPLLPLLTYRPWEYDSLYSLPRVLSVYNTDLSGTKTYSINSLGFRGEEFNADARKRLYFCGCSYTFGVGLNLEETAAHKFKVQYCDHLGLGEHDVNLLNFAVPGASNDYIVRTLLTQCRRSRPDLVVAIFSHADRAEHIDEEALGEKVWTVAPWCIHEMPKELTGPDASLEPHATEMIQVIETVKQAAIGYCTYATESNSAANFLRNVLLLQLYCETHNIPYVFHRMEPLPFSCLDHHFALADMALLIDKTHFIENERLEQYYCDRAADGGHPGPESNSNIASSLFRLYKQLYGDRR